MHYNKLLPINHSILNFFTLIIHKMKRSDKVNSQVSFSLRLLTLNLDKNPNKFPQMLYIKRKNAKQSPMDLP